MKKLHDAGWKNSYFNSADVSMLGYGCGISQYSQFFVKDWDIYQVLPRSYLWSFYWVPGNKVIEKKGIGLGKSRKIICLG